MSAALSCRESAPTTARTATHGAVAAIAGRAPFSFFASSRFFGRGRGAPRLRRGATNAGGFRASNAGCSGVVEARHGLAGARRTLGVWGPFRGPHEEGERVELTRRDFVKTTAAAAVLAGVPLGWRGTAYASDAPETSKVRIGIIALTDCSSIVMAHELGLFKKHGIESTISKEASWAVIRD